MDYPTMKAAALAAIPVFSAAILASNYVLIGLPNVKLFDMLVFVAAYIYGLPTGVAVAAVTWLVYGTVNPYGAASPPLIATLMASQSVYALLGRLAHKRAGETAVARSVWFGLFGAAGAVVYDFITNAFTGFFFYGSVVAGLVAGIPFAVIHTVANLLIFSLAAPPVLMCLTRLSSHSSRG